VLKTILESLNAEARRGNSVSLKLLQSLDERDDALGTRSKEVVSAMDSKENVIEG
jgi:hypothetical protein